MNVAGKYLYHKFIDGKGRWHPFLAVYYLTYRCALRCPYCSNGLNEPYYRLPADVLPADEVMEILARIRRSCEYLVITGGEPLQHPDFGQVIERIGKLGFRDVALNTNGYDIERYLSNITKSVRTLIFSLDTLVEENADAWFGRGKGVFQKIHSNIIRAAEYRGANYRIMISSVATSRNISDLYDVYEFTQRKGFTFAVCPELQGVEAPIELKESSAYRSFFDFMISEKKKGMAIHGTPSYLRHMRDFTRFSCRPFTMLVVDPLGQVFYPCLEIGHVAGNLLESGDLHALRCKGSELFGPQPVCDSRCHSACALGFSLILERPCSMAQEAYLMIKRSVAGHTMERNK